MARYTQQNCQTSNCPAEAVCVIDPCALRRCIGPCQITRPCGSNFCDPVATCTSPTSPTNPCETVRCGSGTTCVYTSGSCGSFSGKRTVGCQDPCKGVNCSKDKKCSLVYLDVNSPCDTNVIGVCGGDPCVSDNKCRSDEGCYTISSCKNGKCTLTTQCRNPCGSYQCPSGQHCVSKPVTCIRAPCNPVASCVDNDPGTPSNPCAAVLCQTNTMCVVVNGQAECRPNTYNPCSDTFCIATTTCQVIDGKAVCVPLPENQPPGNPRYPCAAVQCHSNTTCVVVNGKAECRTNAANPCSQTFCIATTTCQVIDEKAVCVPIPENQM